MTHLKKSVWMFVLVVAIADVAFTCEFRQSVSEWEGNRVAGWILEREGVAGVVLYRALWLGFAWAMARSRARLSWLVTPVWGAGHVYLLVSLIRAYPYLAALGG
jgi:hypothetical protein